MVRELIHPTQGVMQTLASRRIFLFHRRISRNIVPNTAHRRYRGRRHTRPAKDAPLLSALDVMSTLQVRCEGRPALSGMTTLTSREAMSSSISAERSHRKSLEKNEPCPCPQRRVVEVALNNWSALRQERSRPFNQRYIEPPRSVALYDVEFCHPL